jgi:Carboxypeptidase regulatory-like domain
MRNNMIDTTSLYARFCALLVLILTFAAGAFAKSQATTGNIEGRVLDPKEAAVPGATVTATNQQTGFERTTTTNDAGGFLIILLPPGTYTVRATAGGFAQSEIKDLTVNVGGKTPLDINLSVGGASGTVTVSSEAPTVETTLSTAYSLLIMFPIYAVVTTLRPGLMSIVIGYSISSRDSFPGNTLSLTRHLEPTRLPLSVPPGCHNGDRPGNGSDFYRPAFSGNRRNSGGAVYVGNAAATKPQLQSHKPV